MNTAQARESVLGEVLACRDMRPAAFLAEPLEGNALATARARSEALLRALGSAEDSRHHEDLEEAGPAESAIRRLEAKLDLLTALVSRAVRASQPHDPQVRVDWSARGASLQVAAPVAPGTAGQFRIEPSDAFPEALVLPARALACGDEDGTLVLVVGFEELGGPLEEALERHLFRLHRREVAERRRHRG